MGLLNNLTTEEIFLYSVIGIIVLALIGIIYFIAKHQKKKEKIVKEEAKVPKKED